MQIQFIKWFFEYLFVVHLLCPFVFFCFIFLCLRRTFPISIFLFYIIPSSTNHAYTFNNQSLFKIPFYLLGPTGSGLFLKVWFWLDDNRCKYINICNSDQSHIKSLSWYVSLTGSIKYLNYINDQIVDCSEPCLLWLFSLKGVRNESDLIKLTCNENMNFVRVGIRNIIAFISLKIH